jgi:hypothetical protein
VSRRSSPAPPDNEHERGRIGQPGRCATRHVHVLCFRTTRGRAGRVAPLALAALLAGWSLPACSAHPATPASSAARELAVSPAGGVLKIAPGVTLRVGSGSAAGTKVAVQTGPARAAAPLAGAVPLGPSVQITPDRHLPASTIRFAFRPAQLPSARPGQQAPTIGNAFIAVLNAPTHTWLPLPTTYDAAAGQLVAVAPHFSKYAAWAYTPGPILVHVGKTVIHVVIQVGEAGLKAAESEAEAVWHQVQPEFGGLSRTLPADQRITAACAGNDPAQPADQRYQTAGGGSVRSCVVDPGGDTSAPALLLENDFGFPVDLFPQAGAKLPGLTMTSHPDQDLLAALASLAHHGYIPGPGVTRIGFPAPAATSFTVQAHADWLGLVTEIIDTAAAIIPDTEVAETDLASAGEKAAGDAEQAGREAESDADAVSDVDDELKVEKGPAFDTAEAITSVYGCLAGLESSLQTASVTKLAGQIKDCLKELFSGSTTDATGYLKAVLGFIQLPAVLNEFREHGRQLYTITAIEVPKDGTYGGLLQNVDPNTGIVQFEQAEMLTGAAARPYCTAEGVPAGEPCEFYIRHLNIESTAVLAPDAQITSELSPDGGVGTGFPVSVAQLPALIQPAGLYHGIVFTIVIQHGQITSMRGLFHP